MTAINHAIVILSWYEHLPSDEMPPRWMWHLNDELEQHFDMVKANRGNGATNDDDGPMMKNEYARDRGRNAR
jgi:hypothetical protein